MYQKYLLLFVPLLLCGCHSERGFEPQRQSPVTVKVARVGVVEYENRDFVGMATADDAVNLAFKISGQVLSVDVSKGDYVNKNALLARLNPRDVELQVAADLSRYETAKSQYERMKRLLEHKAVSEQEYEAAMATYIQSKSIYENSRDLLAETKLLAPFNGVVERTYVDNFQRVNAGETILRLVNPLSTTVEFTVPERSLPLLSDSTTVFSVLFDNIPDKTFKARLHKFAKTSSDASGFPVALKLSLQDSQHYAISPGMTCQIKMQVPSRVASSVTIPLTAVYAPAQGGVYAWVVMNDSIVEKRAIVLGQPYGRSDMTVLSGLNAGEVVVVAGVYRLHDAERVKILNR